VRLSIDVDAQTPEEAEEKLFKALKQKRANQNHSEEFSDPVAEDAAKRLKSAYRRRMNLFFSELSELLSEEFKK
jgi:hypothetical protein